MPFARPSRSSRTSWFRSAVTIAVDTEASRPKGIPHPCLVPGTMRRIALAGALVALVLAAGCAGDPSAGLPDYEQASPVGFQAVSPDDGGPANWIRLEVHDGDRSYAFEDLNVTVVTPDGTERADPACTAPEGTWADGCQDPFQAGDTVSSGENLWIPCASHGTHRVTVEVAPFDMVDGPADCEAAAGSSGPEQVTVSRSTHDAGGDGQVDWLELVLDAGDSAPYAPGDVTVQVEAPDGQAREDRVCLNASGGWEEGCQDPYDGGDRWQVGGSLFVPCQDHGDHRVTVSVRGTTALDAGFFCDAAA